MGRARFGRGSNQYRLRDGRQPSRTRAETEAIVAGLQEEIEIEAAAAAFGQPVPQLEKARSLDDVVRRIASGSVYDRKRFAGRKNCPPDVLTYLAYDSHHDVLQAVAQNPNTPPEALTVIAEHAPDVAGNLALGNPNCPPDTIQAFYDRYPGASRVVVGCPNTPPVVLEDVADRTGSLVELDLVAEHPNTPPGVLREMAEPDCTYLRRIKGPGAASPSDHRRAYLDDRRFWTSLARNPSTPPDVLDRLGRADHGPCVAVARNPSTPPDTLIWLTRNAPDRSNADLDAARNPSFPTEELDRMLQAGRSSTCSNTERRLGIAASENPTLVGDRLVDAACSYGGKALERALTAKHVPERVFVATTYRGDGNKKVWRAATKHPECPSAVLDAHRFRPDPVTVRYIVAHRNVDPDTLHDMYYHHGDERTRSVVGDELRRRGML